VTYEVDDPRVSARLAAQKYAEEDFRRGDPFTRLMVRVKTDRGTFDVVVCVEMEPEFHAKLPVRVTPPLFDRNDIRTIPSCVACGDLALRLGRCTSCGAQQPKVVP
jgi:hypothetical protein